MPIIPEDKIMSVNYQFSYEKNRFGYMHTQQFRQLYEQNDRRALTPKECPFVGKDVY